MAKHEFISWLAMVVVVAFSSSLDVAAIEMEVGKPLDYNHELMTVGVSNIVSGALGGYTGSYIFSQTIFNLRAKVNRESQFRASESTISPLVKLVFNPGDT